jgi:hypothetical protein
MYILAAVATAGIGLGGTFGASAVPINGKLIGATAPAPEHIRFTTTIDTRADITGEHTTVATTVSPTVLWLVVATATVATAVATTVVISNVVLVA